MTAADFSQEECDLILEVLGKVNLNLLDPNAVKLTRLAADIKDKLLKKGQK